MKGSLRIQVFVHQKRKIVKFQLKIVTVSNGVKVEAKDCRHQILWGL